MASTPSSDHQTGSSPDAERAALFEQLDRLCNTDKFSEAAELNRRLLATGPAAEGWYFQAQLERELGNYSQAEQAAAHAAAADPENPEYLVMQGWSCFDDGRPADAIAPLVAARRLGESVNGLYGLALAQYGLGQIPEALETFGAVTRLAPLDSTAWRWRGVVAQEIGDLDKARASWAQVARLEPKADDAWRSLASVQASLKDFEGAIESFRHARKIAPADTDVMREMAVVFLDKGDWRTSGKLSRRAAKLDFHAVSDAMRRASTRLAPLPPPPVVVSVTLDLKLTPAGRVKICEFNDFWESGLKGYKALTGVEMDETQVLPFYERLSAEWRASGRPWHINQSSYRADSLTYLGDAFTEPNRVFVNSDPAIRALCHYKDFTALNLPKVAAPYFPRTAVVPLSPTGIPFGALDGKPAERVLIKPADGLQSLGVEIMPPAAVPERLAEISGYFAGAPAGEAEDFWRTNRHPNLILQEYEPSTIVQASDGLFYNGTIRAAVTVVLEPRKPARVEFHGAYWKLPRVDCGAHNEREGPEANISAWPGKLSAEAAAAFKGRPFAAPVAPEHLALVEAQLRDCLQILIPAVARPAERFAADIDANLAGRDEARRALATRILHHDTLGPFLAALPGRDPGALGRQLVLNRFRHAEEADILLLQRGQACNPAVPLRWEMAAAYADVFGQARKDMSDRIMQMVGSVIPEMSGRSPAP